MNRKLVPLCCIALFAACGDVPPDTSCQSNADCYDDEICYQKQCQLKPSGGGTGGGVAGGEGGGVAGGTGGGVAGGTGGEGGGLAGGTGGGAPACQTGEKRACCSDRGEETCSAGVWGACDATTSAETCNGLDDDCDGVVDNDLLWDLPDGGTATSVECATNGIGACASSGVYVCDSAGDPVCGAPVIDPVDEVCDDIDNDCDGEVDEGLKILCNPDLDNDRYATDSTTSAHCPDTTRADFGNCPAGFVAPAASLGLDCDPENASLFRWLPARSDADQDGYCTGAQVDVCTNGTLPNNQRAPGSCNATDDCDDNNSNVYRIVGLRDDADGDTYCINAVADFCIGAEIPAGKRIAAQCQATNDCNDSSPTEYVVVSVRTDADGDGYCVNNAYSVCTSGGAPSGTRLAGSCQATADCNDSNSSIFRMALTSADADNDQHCSSAPAIEQCIGANPAAGRRLTSTCLSSSDCNDNNNSQWQSSLFRDDQDGDTYCVGTPQNICYGNNEPAGKRGASACNATNDCNDNNPHATASCTKSVFVPGTPFNCPAAGVPFPVVYNWNCGNGFHAVSYTLTSAITPANAIPPPVPPTVSGQSGTTMINFICIVGPNHFNMTLSCAAD